MGIFFIGPLARIEGLLSLHQVLVTLGFFISLGFNLQVFFVVVHTYIHGFITLLSGFFNTQSLISCAHWWLQELELLKAFRFLSVRPTLCGSLIMTYWL